METIRKEEMLLILGGYDEAECKKLREQANTKDMTQEEWDIWTDKFLEYCI